MNPTHIQLKAVGMELTEAIRNYVTERAESLSKVIDLSDPMTRIAVELGRTTGHHQKGDVFRAEFRVNVGGQSYYGEAIEADLYAAVDEVRDDMLRQLRKSKGRLRDIFERGARSVKKRLKGLKPWGKGQQ